MNCCWRTIWPMVLDTTFIAVVAVVVVRLFSTLRSLTNGIRMKKWRERICVTCFVDVLIEFCLWYVVILIRSSYGMKTSISLSAINTVCACILLSDFPFDGSILLMYSIREQIFAEMSIAHIFDIFWTHFHRFYGTMLSHLLHFHPVKGTILLQYLKNMEMDVSVWVLYIKSTRLFTEIHSIRTKRKRKRKVSEVSWKRTNERLNEKWNTSRVNKTKRIIYNTSYSGRTTIRKL